jgi:hypothetical protein
MERRLVVPVAVRLPLRIAIACSFAVTALCAATKVTADIVRVTVTAQTVATVSAQPAARHWVLKEFPADADVLIKDDAARSQFLAAMKKFHDGAASCNAIILDGKPRDKCGFVANVGVPAIHLNISGPAEILRAPDATVPAQAVEITLHGSWDGASLPAPVQALCIRVGIGPFTGSGTCSVPDPATTPVTLKDLAPGAGLGSLPPQYEAIRIWTTTADKSEKTTAQLQAVAIAAFQTARKLDLLPVPPGGKDVPLRTQDLADALGKLYNIDDSGWPDVRVSFLPISAAGPDAGSYVLSIGNLQTVTHASVVLTPGPLNDDNPKVKARLAEVSCQIENRFLAPLKALEGTIPTNEGAWKIARTIGLSNQVTGVIIPRKAQGTYFTCDKHNQPNPVPEGPADNRIVFTGDHRWVMGSVTGDLTAGLSGNPHDILTGDGKIGEDHLLFPISHTFEDTASLRVNAGPVIQRSDFSFNIEGTAGVMQPFHYGIGVDTVFSRDANQRFGYLAGPKFVDEEYGPTPRAYVAFARPAETYAFTANILVNAGLQFRHVSILPPAAYPPFLNHGWVNGFDPSLTALLGYDFAHAAAGVNASGMSHATPPGGGLGNVFINLNAEELRARKSLAGDFAFNRYTAHVEGEVFFGVTGRQDFVIRYNRGVTASSTATPLFELPEVGGANNIRGIELGEYVGQGFGFDQSEAGVNVMSAWGWLHRKKDAAVKAAALAKSPSAADFAAAAGKPTLSSLGINSIFVGGLYDRAKIVTGSSLGALLDLEHGFHGAGVKAEVRGLRAGNRKANLSFIYAHSPDSVLHHKGTFLVSVSLDF